MRRVGLAPGLRVEFEGVANLLQGRCMSEPVYFVRVDGEILAELSLAEQRDGKWWDYHVEPATLAAAQSIRESVFWEGGLFEVVDSHGRQPHPGTFAGEVELYCQGFTDRIAFHALTPPAKSHQTSVLTWLAVGVAIVLVWLLIANA